MNHLVEAEHDPVFCSVSIVVAAEPARSGFHTVHHEVQASVDQSQPPYRRSGERANQPREGSVNASVSGQREEKAPIHVEFAQHPAGLEDVVGEIVLALEGDEKKKDV